MFLGTDHALLLLHSPFSPCHNPFRNWAGALSKLKLTAKILSWAVPSLPKPEPRDWQEDGIPLQGRIADGCAGTFPRLRALRHGRALPAARPRAGDTPPPPPGHQGPRSFNPRHPLLLPSSWPVSQRKQRSRQSYRNDANKISTDSICS